MHIVLIIGVVFLVHSMGLSVDIDGDIDSLHMIIMHESYEETGPWPGVG